MIEPIKVNEELSLEEAETLLIKTVNFGDYLAEELKKSRLIAADHKAAFNDKKHVELELLSGGDAKSREIKAETKCRKEWKIWQTSEIETDFIQDLNRNNHDKAEALRTIISSKKTVFEKTYNAN